MNIPRGLNRCLIDDLQRIRGTADLLDWVEAQCSELATWGLSNRCVRLTKPLLERAGITEVVVAPDTNGNGLASLVPSDASGYTIRLRPFLKSQDRRFAIAHEIAHTFWYRQGGGGMPLSRMQSPYGSDETIEWLSNRAGAALLVPKLFLQSRPHGTLIQVFRGDLHLLANCAQELDVPERLLARRVLNDLLNQSNIILAVEVPSALDREPYIQWAAVPDAVRPGTRQRLEGKHVPREAVPQVGQAKTRQVSMDGRWRSFLLSCLERPRMLGFANCTDGPTVNATVGRWGSRFLISISLSEEALLGWKETATATAKAT